MIASLIIASRSLFLLQQKVPLNWRIELPSSRLAIRHDAVVRSKAVIVGQVTEHLLPFMSAFPYNPYHEYRFKWFRIIGHPRDDKAYRLRVFGSE